MILFQKIVVCGLRDINTMIQILVFRIKTDALWERMQYREKIVQVIFVVVVNHCFLQNLEKVGVKINGLVKSIKILVKIVMVVFVTMLA
jgi:hypothetical protein